MPDKYFGVSLICWLEVFVISRELPVKAGHSRHMRDVGKIKFPVNSMYGVNQGFRTITGTGYL